MVLSVYMIKKRIYQKWVKIYADKKCKNWKFITHILKNQKAYKLWNSNQPANKKNINLQIWRRILEC
jgi:hypothetical protein